MMCDCHLTYRCFNCRAVKLRKVNDIIISSLLLLAFLALTLTIYILPTLP